MTIQESLRHKLELEFHPVHLDIVNESNNHNVPPNSETHFKVTLVADGFAGLRPVQRHQRVYRAVAEELAGPVHALALHTFTPAEWQRQGVAPQSPPCLGGEGSDGENNNH